MDITTLFEQVHTKVDALKRRIERLEKIVTPEIEVWQTPTLLNSWVNYGGSYSPAGYYKDPFNVVHLRGSIKNGTTTAGTVLFTLPVGYRPEYNYVMIQVSAPITLPGVIVIFPNGNVTLDAGNNTLLSLDNIHFRAV